MKIPLAIVGNGGAAAEAVLALRAEGYSGGIHLFSENSRPPYNPMLGSYLVSGAVAPERTFPFGDADRFYGGNSVTTHLGSRVVSLDALAQTFATADGSTYEYERCLVATGSQPTVPPVPGLREAVRAGGGTGNMGGTDGAGSAVGAGGAGGAGDAGSAGGAGGAGGEPKNARHAFTLRSLEDALALKQAIDGLRARGGHTPRVAVIGASFVGLKVAELLHEMGMRVCLVEREPHILPRSAHPECAALMEVHLAERGYDLRLAADVQAAETHATGISLQFGKKGGEAPAEVPAEVPAGSSAAGGRQPDGRSADTADFDLVVVCTGIRPSLDFLAQGQVVTGPGIIVDEQMRSSVPTLYAAGDVAQGMNLMSGRREIIALWASARYQGRAAGRSLAGAPNGYRGSVPSNISHVGELLFASVGDVENYDRLTVSQQCGALQLRTWRGDELVGVNLLDCCLSAGVMRQALIKAAAGAAPGTREATWISFNG